MTATSAKIRLGPAGLHYFNRSSGLNVLFDEIRPNETSWHAAPRQISIALTNTCDLDCPYCYAPKSYSIIDYEWLCGWLCEFDQYGALGVGFGGGEPTLHPHFSEICEFTTNQTKLAVTFTTHGHQLKPKLLTKLDGKVNFVRLSMDGVKSTYERLRGKSFAEFTQRVRGVASITSFGLNFVVNADTIDDLDDAISFAHAEGAHEFLLLPEQPTGSRRGIGFSELIQLRRWVHAYQGDVRLTVSEAGAEGMDSCDPTAAEYGLRAYAHITAAGRLQYNSFATAGVPIAETGAMAALRELQKINAYKI